MPVPGSVKGGSEKQQPENFPERWLTPPKNTSKGGISAHKKRRLERAKKTAGEVVGGKNGVKGPK